VAGREAVKRKDIVGFLDGRYECDLHVTRVLSLANATLGTLSGASLTVHATGQGLADTRMGLTKHGVKQIDRPPPRRSKFLPLYSSAPSTQAMRQRPATPAWKRGLSARRRRISDTSIGLSLRAKNPPMRRSYLAGDI
jgi:hypothetical protein